MDEKILKIWYCDFEQGFNFQDTIIFEVLSDFYVIVLDANNPDILFYGTYGVNYKKYHCKKIQISNECPNKNELDDTYYIGYIQDNNPKHFYALCPFLNKTDLLSRCIFQGNLLHRETNEASTRKFCAFLVSNWGKTQSIGLKVKGTDRRIDMFRYITCSYKRVDSGGAVYNNIGELIPKTVEAMADFYSTHKYAIACENVSCRGFLTEKLFIPLAYGCIPIYYGDTNIDEIINPDCYINANDMSNKQIVEKIKEIEGNDELYQKMISAPVFRDEHYLDKMISNLLKFIENIIES